MTVPRNESRHFKSYLACQRKPSRGSGTFKVPTSCQGRADPDELDIQVDMMFQPEVGAPPKPVVGLIGVVFPPVPIDNLH